MIRTTTVLSGIAVMALTAGALSACSSSNPSANPSSDSQVWRIGVEAPLSGDLSNLGQGMLNGAQLAADQINTAGGVLGKNIQIVPIDDAGDPTTGVTAANSAIAAGLNGVVGPYNSGVGVKTLPLYLQAGLTPIRLTSDNATDGQGFTLQPMSNQIAPVEVEALTKFYGAKSVAIAYDSTQNYTTNVSQTVQQQLQAAKVKVTDYVPIQPGQDSYSTVINQLKQKQPDVIFAAVYYPEGAKFAQEIGSGTKCLLDYASYDNGYIQNAGASAKNCQVGGVPAPADFANSQSQNSAYQTKFGQPAGTWTPYTYDSVKFLVDGVAKVGSWDSGPLTSYLKTVKDWTGWTGSVTIDPANGNRSPATVVVTNVNSSNAFEVDQAWAKKVGAPY